MYSIATIKGFNNPNEDVMILEEYPNYYIIDRNNHVTKIKNVVYVNYEEGATNNERYIYFLTDSGKLVPYVNKYFLKKKKLVKL